MNTEEIVVEDILPNGTRIWVFEPMISVDRIPGKICGFIISYENGEMDLQYQVDFGKDLVSWISDFQITGWLKLVACERKS